MARLNIKSIGIVKGGYVDYSFSSDGTISYSGKVTVQIFYITKDLPFSGSLHTDIANLKSISFLEGVDIKIGPVAIHVDQVSMQGGRKVAAASISMQGVGQGRAEAYVDSDLFAIKLIDVKGKVAGWDVEIHAS